MIKYLAYWESKAKQSKSVSHFNLEGGLSEVVSNNPFYIYTNFLNSSWLTKGQFQPLYTLNQDSKFWFYQVAFWDVS